LKHVRAGKDVFIKEIESAGFRRLTDAKPLIMKENFFVTFEKISGEHVPIHSRRGVR
jgi:hypothetical protein